MKTPSQILAKKTLERLRTEKLLTPGEVKKLLPKFVEGKIRAEDWRLAVKNGDVRVFVESTDQVSKRGL